jgi:hypothetical protein
VTALFLEERPQPAPEEVVVVYDEDARGIVSLVSLRVAAPRRSRPLLGGRF